MIEVETLRHNQTDSLQDAFVESTQSAKILHDIVIDTHTTTLANWQAQHAQAEERQSQHEKVV